MQSRSHGRRGHRRGQIVGVFVAAMLLIVTVGGVPAAVAAGDAETKKGTLLVERFFDSLQARDSAALAKILAPAFLLQGADGGVLDREDFLANPSQVESYDLTNVRVTCAGKVIVARYDVAAVVNINGVPQSRAPAPRLSVFAKGEHGWQSWPTPTSTSPLPGHRSSAPGSDLRRRERDRGGAGDPVDTAPVATAVVAHVDPATGRDERGVVTVADDLAGADCAVETLGEPLDRLEPRSVEQIHRAVAPRVA